MMLKRSSYKVLNEDVDITPMLDVVFILLIFFIVTASFIKEEGVALNKLKAAEQAETRESIVLQVLESSAIKIQNRLVDMRVIKAIVTRHMAEQPDATVVVKLHKRAKTRDVVKALDALQDARVFNPPVSLIN